MQWNPTVLGALAPTVVAAALLGTVAQAQDYGTSAERRGVSSGAGSMVGARLELIDVDDVEGISTGGAVFAEKALSDVVNAGGSLTYWRGEDNTQETGYDVSDLILGAHVRGFIGQVSARVRPYAVVGADLHRVSVTLDQEDATGNPLADDDDRDETRAGVNLGAGTLIALAQQLDATAGVQYRQVIGDEDMQFNQLVFAGGMAFRL